MGEDQKQNDIFFVCSLIEKIARQTNNTKKYIIEKIGEDEINKIYKLAEVYHSENIDKVAEEIIKKEKIQTGDYNIFSKIRNTNPPTYWDIGRVYQRLIIQLSKNKEEYVDKLIEVMTSWIIFKFDNYDSSLYYENPSYIYECYNKEKIL